ncbi:MAG: FRG domain-containing protein [Hydrogenovibrio sp.]|uniref:FRG domain-containing protein n=1 Tax=Hydrogenovibrio sp. TaxID=2065821 RepID=UPI0028706C32|nr:FRG domain-containing protein [Hydrogenovibrio sp.]MDR9498432.1 FRG domain-containing protein [Hydrogenovibrio sp.]
MAKEIQFDSIQSYMQIVQDLPGVWELNPSALWFRGVKESSYSLVPGCVWRGINLEVEDSCVAEFLIHYRSLFQYSVQDPLELYALMQHYGLPTRLLDWTSSPLIALYFALENESATHNTVWVMSPVDLNKITVGLEVNIVPKANIEHCFIKPWLPVMLRDGGQDDVPPYPFAIKHPLVNPRISAQKGCFTFHGNQKDGIEKYFQASGNECIAKLVLKTPSKRSEILQQLYSLGFKEDDIYRDLSSLTKRILREQSLLVNTR